MTSPFSSIVGESQAIKAARDKGLQVARMDATVLLVGESGTGKELFAHAIHGASRRTGKFLALNCAAFPEDLFESELLGHERGAFTGAVFKLGLILTADRGTLLLDEINSLAPKLQAKLLRVIEDKTVRHVGGEIEHSFDVRLIAATNQEPDILVSRGQLREDFYYRIQEVLITIPPLRDRREDIPELVKHFIRNSELESKRDVVVSPTAMKKLKFDEWRGNVRELKNYVREALIGCHTGTLDVCNLPSRKEIADKHMTSVRSEQRTQTNAINRASVRWFVRVPVVIAVAILIRNQEETGGRDLDSDEVLTLAERVCHASFGPEHARTRIRKFQDHLGQWARKPGRRFTPELGEGVDDVKPRDYHEFVREFWPVVMKYDNFCGIWRPSPNEMRQLGDDI